MRAAAPPARNTHIHAPVGRRAGGFTLIEVMITVLLIAVLVFVALPSYRGYRERVLSAQAISDLVSMSTAIDLFARDARAPPADLAMLGLANKLDPWGNSYVYYNVQVDGRGGARKDRALNPINTDFDLYSMGPDGKTKKQITQKDSVDDVIRASNGAFLGIASGF